MKIIVLDGFAMNPGDLSWDELAALGETAVYERTRPDETAARAKGAAVVLTNKTVLGADILEQLPDLRYIGVLATGYNVVDVAAAKAKGIVVTNVPAYSTDSVAQMVFAHLTNLTLRLGEHTESVRRGEWVRNQDFSYHLGPLVELAGMTMGIVGYGQTGKAVTRIALAFGMKVQVCTRTQPKELSEGVELVEMDGLFRKSDVVSLHCPLTDETDKLVNQERLKLMKPSAFLINTGRGPLLDEAAVAEALNSGRIAGAGVDVLSTEPPQADNPLLAAKNIFITPHIAWATVAARKRLMDVAVGNVKAFLEGAPVNVVS